MFRHETGPQDRADTPTAAVGAGQAARQDRDIRALELRLDARIRETKLELDARLSETNARIAETKADLTRWVIGAGVLQTTIIIGVLLKVAKLV